MKYMFFNLTVAGCLIYLLIGSDVSLPQIEDNIFEEKLPHVSQIFQEVPQEEPLSPVTQNQISPVLVEVANPAPIPAVEIETLEIIEETLTLAGEEIVGGEISGEEVALMSLSMRQKELDKLVQSLEMIYLEQAY